MKKIAKGLRKINFTELAPGFRSDKDCLKMGCENVKLFLRKPLIEKGGKFKAHLRIF
jgi:hypothetical protein